MNNHTTQRKSEEAAQDWWKDKDHFVQEYKVDEWGLTEIYAREVEGQWEYAFTHWRHGSASLVVVLRGGKVFNEIS